MELLQLVTIIFIFVLFLYFVRSFLSTVKTSSSLMPRLYIDGRIYELTSEHLVVNTQAKEQFPPGHFEETIEVLNRIAPYREIYGTDKIYFAINSMLSLPYIAKHLRKESNSKIEIAPFLPDKNYGGCYFETNSGSAFTHAIGGSETILSMCSSLHDKEEILRISQKWTKQGYLVASIATGDVYGDKKNVFVRGVKEKLTFLGLLAIENS